MKNTRDAVRAAFAQRLNTLLDHYDVPAKHAGRQMILKEKIGVSQESARKWLEGESIPREHTLVKICNEYPCRKAWLHNGEDPMFHDEMTAELLARWHSYSDHQKQIALELFRGYGGKPEDQDD